MVQLTFDLCQMLTYGVPNQKQTQTIQVNIFFKFCVFMSRSNFYPCQKIKDGTIHLHHANIWIIFHPLFWVFESQ